jgi:CopG family transcriptional regulator / antitoxin EndoAI
LKYTRIVCRVNSAKAVKPNTMSKRLNIILPDKTVAILDRVTTKGNRSRFIDRAVRQLIQTEGRSNLRASLKEEALANADRDLAIAADWYPLEEEAAQFVETNRARKPTRKRA